MPELSDDHRRQLEALRRAYEAELPDKVTGVGHAAAAAGMRNWNAEELRELYQRVHRLAGSSAIWGFTAVSRAAGALEEVVLAAMEGPRPLTPELSHQVGRLIEELQHAVPPDDEAGPRHRGAS